MERVRVSGTSRMPSRQGRGVFAQVLMDELPLLPVEEEGRLGTPLQGALVEFHTQHKLARLAHSEPHLRRLGRLVAAAKTRPLRVVVEEYGRLLMQALAVLATVRKHVNVLQHIVGYFTDRLTTEERGELREVISDYHRKLVPLVVPLTLIRHYVKKYRVGYIQEQVYLQPHPKELMLRNHV